MLTGHSLHVGQVKNSLEGWAAGRSIPGFLANVSKAFLQQYYCRWLQTCMVQISASLASSLICYARVQAILSSDICLKCMQVWRRACGAAACNAAHQKLYSLQVPAFLWANGFCAVSPAY